MREITEEELEAYRPLTKEEAERFWEWQLAHSVVRQILQTKQAEEREVPKGKEK
jgi:hypothetical protein